MGYLWHITGKSDLDRTFPKLILTRCIRGTSLRGADHSNDAMALLRPRLDSCFAPD